MRGLTGLRANLSPRGRATPFGGGMRARRNQVACRFVPSDERIINVESGMARGDKSKYTEKQKRQAEHIEEGYEQRGVSEPEAERRAWATVNKMTGGGKRSGSGRGQPVNKAPAKKGGGLAVPPLLLGRRVPVRRPPGRPRKQERVTSEKALSASRPRGCRAVAAGGACAARDRPHISARPSCEEVPYSAVH
jgi:plasmid stabilization system protein ParE